MVISARVVHFIFLETKRRIGIRYKINYYPRGKDRGGMSNPMLAAVTRTHTELMHL